MMQQQRPLTTASSTGAQSSHAATSAPVIVVVAALENQAFVEAALSQPAPRSVRLSAPARLLRFRLINVIVACFAFAFAVGTMTGDAFATKLSPDLYKLGLCAVCWTLMIARQWAREARLLRDGVAVMGTVTAVLPKSKWRLDAAKVTYQFQTADGVERTRQITLPTAVTARFTSGQTLTILYNPSRPEESFPYSAITDVVIE